jgi:DNA-binding transcriptional LysR family regulator
MNRSGLVELDTVAAVARLGGFRAAAIELGVSATSVSNAVAGLEARLGVRLFNRTTRSVSLSEAGEQFIAAVSPALSDIHAAMAATISRRGRPAGTLRLNCPAEAARQILVPVVLEFQRLYPEVRVDIVTDAQLIDIVAKGFDAGIRPRDAVPGDMIAVPFGPELRFAVVGSPAYLRDHPAPAKPADLLAHRCIRARWPSGALYRWEFAKQGRALTIDAPGSLTLDEPTLMRDAALAGAGLAYMWEARVRGDLACGHLVSVLDDWMPSSPGF